MMDSQSYFKGLGGVTAQAPPPASPARHMGSLDVLLATLLRGWEEFLDRPVADCKRQHDILRRQVKRRHQLLHNPQQQQQQQQQPQQQQPPLGSSLRSQHVAQLASDADNRADAPQQYEELRLQLLAFDEAFSHLQQVSQPSGLQHSAGPPG
jgi:hypothetical protein